MYTGIFIFNTLFKDCGHSDHLITIGLAPVTPKNQLLSLGEATAGSKGKVILHADQMNH